MATAAKNSKSASKTEEDSRPQYRLTEPAYIDDVLYDTGATVIYAGEPGPHMEPLNAAADEACEKVPEARRVFRDPIEAMAQI